MNKIKNIIILFICLLFITACRNDSDDNTNDNAKPSVYGKAVYGQSKF